MAAVKKKSHAEKVDDLEKKLPKDEKGRQDALRKGTHCGGKVRMP